MYTYVFNLLIDLLILFVMVANLYAGVILAKRYGFKYGLLNFAATIFVGYMMVNKILS